MDFRFELTLIFITSLTQTTIVCQLNEMNPLCGQNLAIDSAFVDKHSDLGEEVVTLISNDIIIDLKSKNNIFRFVRSKRLSDWSTDITPPINSSYSDKDKLVLINSNAKHFWKLFPKNKSFIERLSVGNTFFETMEDIDDKIGLEHQGHSIKANVFKSGTKDKTVYTLAKKGAKVKLVDSNEDNNYETFDHLSGHVITAGFVFNGFWYLLADNLICRMKVTSKQWNDFCVIQAIGEWLGCPAPKASIWSHIMTAVIIGVIIGVIIAGIIIISVIVYRRSAKKDNKGDNSYKNERKGSQNTPSAGRPTHLRVR